MKTHYILWSEPTAGLRFRSRAATMLSRVAFKIRVRREAREIRRTATLLSTLSDKTLQDIGLMRGSIEVRLCEHSLFNRNRQP
jgi:uncharacterized protein YjiS (DUF1127 family)